MSRTPNTQAKHSFRAKKRLGQNFLVNPYALRRIADAVQPGSGDCVLEIGAGIGNLSTRIAGNSGCFHAVEKDTDLAPLLGAALEKFPNANIIWTDILDFSLAGIFNGKKIKVVGNLPYYITSPIINRLLEQREYIDTIHLTVQKEVARRIVASPGTKDFGRLTCLVQYYCTAELLEVFPRHFFSPEPSVDSALIRLNVLPVPSIGVSSEKMFFQTVKAIFSQRRKILLNGLVNGGWGLPKETLVKILQWSGIVPTIRGEQLSLPQIGKLSDTIDAYLRDTPKA